MLIPIAKKLQQTEGAGASFTEVLDDGTEITVFEQGGFIQVNPDGTTIRSFIDGRVQQTKLVYYRRNVFYFYSYNS